MPGSDSHNSHSSSMGQPPPPPLSPPMTLSQSSKDRTVRGHRNDRIQRSLEAMTVRHTREDVQQLIFRYLQQSGYLRSAMSFAYECMASVGQQPSPYRRGWSPRHPLHLAANSTEYQRFLHSGPTFSKLLQQQILEAEASESTNETSNTDTTLEKETWDQMIDEPGVDEMAAAETIVSAFYNRRDHNVPSALFATPYGPDDMESFPSSVASRTHPKHPTNRQVPRGSSPLGTILLLLVIYALLRLGSLK